VSNRNVSHTVTTQQKYVEGRILGSSARRKNAGEYPVSKCSAVGFRFYIRVYPPGVAVSLAARSAKCGIRACCSRSLLVHAAQITVCSDLAVFHHANVLGIQRALFVLHVLWMPNYRTGVISCNKKSSFGYMKDKVSLSGYAVCPVHAYMEGK
jgi:hypothetical protein